MNEIRKTTIVDRIKNAIEAFKGNPISKITFGIRVVRCENCAHADIVHCRDCRYYGFDTRCRLWGMSHTRLPNDFCSKGEFK